MFEWDGRAVKEAIERNIRSLIVTLLEMKQDGYIEEVEVFTNQGTVSTKEMNAEEFLTKCLWDISTKAITLKMLGSDFVIPLESFSDYYVVTSKDEKVLEVECVNCEIKIRMKKRRKEVRII